MTPEAAPSGWGTRAVAAALAAVTTPLLPAWALVTALHPRLRRDLGERWGRTVPPAAVGATWVCAASVGELGAAEALIPHLSGPVLLTADTDTGAERARAIAASFGGRVVAAARPVDHPLTIAPLWAEARPRALVFVEGTYWPQLAARAARAGVPVLRVSAKAGRRTRRLVGPTLLRLVYDATAAVAARDEAEAAFFRAQGVPVVVGGDLKGDKPVPPNPLRFSRPFVVGCSTRPGEEEALIDALRRVGDRVGRPQLLLAPRHRERFDGVWATLGGLGVRAARRSALTDGVVPADADVVLLDTIGELAGCLRGAAAAFVGGTYDPDVGGHSPAEAARAGVPVIAGPERHANRDAFRAADVIDAPTPDRLGDALIEAMTASRPQAWANDAGARTAHALRRWLDGPPAPEATPRPWLWPVAGVWAAVVALRDLPRRLGVTRPVPIGVPVIAVGSTNARGPGKTSTARWAAERLRERGHVVGVALRGYGRARRGGDVRLSTTTPDAADLGDEGALLARAGLLVAAGPDRLAAARALVAAGATAIVLDDGLQQGRLRCDVALAVVDLRFPNARGLMPAGERRAWRAVPTGATAVIAQHAGEPGAIPPAPGQAIARRRPGPWHRGDRPSPPPEGAVAAFAGVARPADVLAGLDVSVARFRALADHAVVDDALADELFRWADGRPLVTTAKDWVRLPPGRRGDVFWRDVVLEVTGADEDAWFPRR